MSHNSYNLLKRFDPRNKPKQVISRIAHKPKQSHYAPIVSENRNVPIQKNPTKVPGSVMAYTDVLERSRQECQFNTITVIGINSDQIEYHGRIDGWIENALGESTGSLQDDSATKIATLYGSTKIPVMIDDMYLGNIVRISATDIWITGCKAISYEFQIVYAESGIRNAIVKGLNWASAKHEAISGTVVGIADRLILKLKGPFTIEAGEKK